MRAIYCLALSTQTDDHGVDSYSNNEIKQNMAFYHPDCEIHTLDRRKESK